MSLFKSLVKNLKQQATGRRTWTPAEVRELIDRKALDEARQALDQLADATPDRVAARACLLGEVLFQQGDDAGAAKAFHEALSITPGMPSAHLGLSTVHAEAGAFDDALRHAFFASSVEPREARFAAQVGYCQVRLGNYRLAELPLRRATLLSPRDAHVWNNLGVSLLAKGALEEAYDCFTRAVEINPEFGSAAQNLAQLRSDLTEKLGHEPGEPGCQSSSNDVNPDEEPGPLREVRDLERAGQLQAAISACEDILLDHPEATVAIELNRLYKRAGDPASGVDALQAFLSMHPGHTDVVGALGMSHLDSREFGLALECLELALGSEPDTLDYIVGCANALAGLERYDEASVWFDRAIALEPQRLDIRIARVGNLANQCRYEEAIEACEALEHEGVRLSARPLALACLGHFEEAKAEFEKNIELSPNDPTLLFHRASLRLLTHDFAGGWEDYAFRSFSNAESFRALPFSLWKGEPLAGKRVLVLAEQGLGDQVMFASCLPDLIAEGPAEVIVEAIYRIAPTIQRSFPDCRIIATSQGRKLDWLKDCEGVDYYVPLADLPRYYRRSVEDFPDHSGYLKAAPDRVAHWRDRLMEAGGGPYIGFSWKGGTESTRTKLRTTQPLSFKPLADSINATWVCLQYGTVASQVEDAREHGFSMTYWPESIANLDEFAALVSALDLVITVCNTTVHYAGALGRPLWVIAPKVPEWRYGATSASLPWYPRSKVYRQTEAGDWSGVLEQTRQDLSLWARRGAGGA